MLQEDNSTSKLETLDLVKIQENPYKKRLNLENLEASLEILSILLVAKLQVYKSQCLSVYVFSMLKFCFIPMLTKVNPLGAESVQNFGIFLSFYFPKHPFKYSKSHSHEGIQRDKTSKE